MEIERFTKKQTQEIALKHTEYCAKCSTIDWFSRVCHNCGHDKINNFEHLIGKPNLDYLFERHRTNKSE